jgi:hypothetical protein
MVTIWEGMMAAVQENQNPRRRRARQMDGRRSSVKVCSVCQTETRWLSVDGKCWDCTIKAAKNKVPLFIELQDEDFENPEVLQVI